MRGDKKVIRENPSLWKRIVKKIKNSKKYGGRGWNARKAQIAVKEYKEEGGKYKNKKPKSNSLIKWTKQDWHYSSEEMEKKKGRYFPDKVWKKLSPQEKSAQNKLKLKSRKQHKRIAPYNKKITKLVKNAK